MKTRTHSLALGIAMACFVEFGALIGASAGAAEPEPATQAVRTAVARALPVLAKGADGYMAERKCFACHHQTVPLLALATAGRRGFAIDDAYVERVASFVLRSLESGRSRYLEGRGQGGNTITAGYALWTLKLADHKPSETTAMVTEYLTKAQSKDIHWRVTTNRPPSEGSHFAATFVALRGLQDYGTAEQRKAVAGRLDEVRSWLAATEAKDTEDRVFRLWGLGILEADEAIVRKARDELVATQRADGGWGQLKESDSDAYATGTALVALREAAGMKPTEKAYRRGTAYLLKTQKDDGSWLVKSRSKPIQTFFETGFPHGPDQFISAAATGWAATALALSMPVRVEP